MLIDATPQDLERVLEFRARFPPSALKVRGVTAQQRLESVLANYRRYWKWVGKDPNFYVWLWEVEQKIEGLLLLVVGSHDSITDEPQGILLDLCAPQSEVLAEMLAHAEETARQRGMDYVVGDISVDLPELETVVESRGYVADLNRIISDTSHPPRLRGRYPVRMARSSDYFFVLSLNSLVNENTIPPGRKVDPRHVSRGYLSAYSGLKIGEDPKMPTWIAEDPDSDRLAGYLMVKLGSRDPNNGKLLGYIYEIAVHPDFWGRRVVDELLGTAAHWLHQHSIPYLTGDISSSNLRALKTAQRQLGFILENRRWSLSLNC